MWQGGLIKAGIFSDGNNVDIFRGNLSISGGMLDYNPSGGKDYYVDGNDGQAGRTGFGWDKSLDSLVEALALSHTWIGATARGRAARNRIFVKGDDIAEDLVALAQKTDIIGVGSSDNHPQGCLRGNHVPVNNAMGCRFFNMRFKPAASSDLWVLKSTTGGGIEYWGCQFEALYGAYTAPSAIDATAQKYMKVMNSEFVSAFSGDVIDLGAGRMDALRICDNAIMGGADDGIIVTGTLTTAQGRNGLIARNIIQVAGITINDGADSVLYSIDNRLISAAAVGASSYVITAGYGQGNIVTGSDDTNNIPSLAD